MRRTRISTYRLLLPTGLAIIVGPMLSAARDYALGDVGLILFGMLPLLEGLLLASDHGGQTQAIVDRLRGEGDPSLLSTVPVFVWRFVGLCVAFIGGLLVFGGAVHLVHELEAT